MSNVSEAALWIAAVAAGVAGVVYLVRGARRAVQAIGAIQDIVQRELEHNHGSSIKDDVHGMAVAIGILQRDREEDRELLDNALQLAAKHHPDDAWLYIRRKRT
jgi:hypothetical protein